MKFYVHFEKTRECATLLKASSASDAAKQYTSDYFESDGTYECYVWEEKEGQETQCIRFAVEAHLEIQMRILSQRHEELHEEDLPEDDGI